ncbi:HEAT repeat domain-containing protein [Ralstonia sp. NFACC01]|uniref:HEAT repeat domain-containing protein n=1 Tax=Ralstonia sp. NFACC01 TaxID=1566294 RepID=UPI0008F0C181|nr:HEAT repeat domain-containing protein [Ralstonia sp. NFACC01]SFO86248.1 HEAT repeat-containing protein [Ralstonia sp. NFACC01]
MANETDALNSLLQILNGREAVGLRVAAIEGLGIIGGSVARQELIKILNAREAAEVRAAAARALGQATHR